MKSRHRMVSAAVALICTAILVLFTDIDLKLIRWVNCGPVALQRDRHSGVCH